MGRASTKENKNKYHLAREEMGYTREEASDEIKVLTADRIEKIENERIEPQPYDVLAMSKAYNKPSLCTGEAREITITPQATPPLLQAEALFEFVGAFTNYPVFRAIHESPLQ